MSLPRFLRSRWQHIRCSFYTGTCSLCQEWKKGFSPHREITPR